MTLQTMPCFDAVRRLYAQDQPDALPTFDAAARYRVDAVHDWVTSNMIREQRAPLMDIMKAVPVCAPVARDMWQEFTYRGRHDGKDLVVDVGIGIETLADAVEDPGSLRRAAEWSPPFTPPDAVRWVLACKPFFRSSGFDPDFNLPITFLFLGTSGEFLQSIGSDDPPVLTREIMVACATLGFLHCKNVVTTEHRPSRQVLRASARDGVPIITYKTLNIAPMREVLEREGGASQHGIARALHICRGHFSHYTDDKPLFGKYTGTFYIPQHVRGSLKAGAVVKDYQVLQ